MQSLDILKDYLHPVLDNYVGCWKIKMVYYVKVIFPLFK